MQESTLTVPAEYRGRFEHEASSTLSYASDSVDEKRRWVREGKGDDRLDDHLETYSLPRLAQAQHLHSQLAASGGGPLRIEGAAVTIRETLDGCLMSAAVELDEQAESRSEPATRQRVRELAHEVLHWVDQHDRLEDSLFAELAHQLDEAGA